MTRLTMAILAVVLAQAAGAPQFRSEVELVELDVSVTRGGQPVPGLTAADFVVTDNGVPQTIDTVSLDRLPLTVTVALDVSSSVSGARLRHLSEAVEGLAGALKPDDRLALLTFSHAVTLRVPFTSDPRGAASALDGLAGGGATSLRDAVYLAAAMCPRDDSRPLVLVFSDGHDTASWLTERDALQAIGRAGLVVHAIRTDEDPFLDALAARAGGRTWSATSDSQLRELFGRALEEMRARYLITYTPRGVKAPGWHAVGVTLRRGRADIVARPGYDVAPGS